MRRARRQVSSVFDASALLAMIFGERGASEILLAMEDGAVVSAVNLSEVLTRLAERGATDDRADEIVVPLVLDVRAFDEEQAHRAARLRAPTRHLGLSLGDRACLALAQQTGLPAVTTDRAWATLNLGIEVQVIR